jgi:hypothetical protein
MRGILFGGLLALFGLLGQGYAFTFGPVRAPIVSRRVLAPLCMMSSPCASLQQSAPGEPKAGLKLVLRGSSIASAVFRADLKKEVTFFRGCAAEFQLNRKGDEGVLVTEGKTASLAKVLDWLAALELPQSERKPNFQGPSVVIQVASGSWQPFTSKLQGFLAGKEPPLDGDHTVKKGETEANSMAGTDESV